MFSSTLVLGFVLRLQSVLQFLSVLAFDEQLTIYIPRLTFPIERFGPSNVYSPPGYALGYIIIGGRGKPAANAVHNIEICLVLPCD